MILQENIFDNIFTTEVTRYWIYPKNIFLRDLTRYVLNNCIIAVIEFLHRIYLAFSGGNDNKRFFVS